MYKRQALSLPTEAAAKIALRTQQVIAFESGVTDTVDPLAGSYFVETLTDEIEKAAQAYIDKIDAMGGSVYAIAVSYTHLDVYKRQGLWFIRRRRNVYRDYSLRSA